MSADELRARKCWRTLEPYHGFIYFADEAADEYAGLGITGRSGYFVSRAAAMGRVAAPTVIATFYNFNPELVRDALAAAPAWDPAAVTDARYRAVDRVVRDRLGEGVGSEAMQRAAELATEATVGLEPHCGARPLALGHLDQPVPDEPHLRLWWAVTALREFRGDGHVVALADAELSGLEALVMHAASGDVPADVLRTTRAWSEDEWQAAVDGLARRGLVYADGSLTAEGSELRQRVEDRTDRLAAPAWSRLDDEQGAELRTIVRPWSQALFSGRGR